MYLSRILHSADRNGLSQVIILFLAGIGLLSVIVITAIALAAEWFLPSFWITVVSIPAGLGFVMLLIRLQKKPGVLIILEGLLLILYLTLLSVWLDFGAWLYAFAFPVIGVSTVLMLSAVYILKRRGGRDTYAAIMVVLAMTAAVLLFLEVLLDRLLYGEIELFWSLLAAVSLAGTTAVLQFLKQWALRYKIVQK
jgi:hypothetical protein